MSSDKVSLDVQKREATGKEVAILREEEIVPAVVYGKDFTPMNIQAPYLEVARTVREAGTHSPVDLMIDGKKQTTLIKSVDMDHVKNRISHISFQAISSDQVVTTIVPIVVVGFEESEASKTGLELMQSVDEIEVKAKASDLPEKLEVSATEAKEAGDKMTIAEVKLPNGVVLAYPNEAELTIASIIDPEVEAAKAEAAEKAAAEAEAEAAPATEEETSGDGASAEANAEADKPAEEAKTE